jgi:hypothetical protein
MLKRLIHKWERRIVARTTDRVIRPFEWGHEFLGDLEFLGDFEFLGDTVNGRERAKEVIIDFNKRAISDSDNFFTPEPVKDFSLDGDLLTFSSPLQTPYAENNTVYARYFPAPPGKANGGSRGDEAARARGRACIVLPQWNGDGESHVALCRWLNRLGIAALRVSLPYHDRRRLSGFERADYMVSANIGRTLQATRQAVLDARAGIDWLVSRGYDRIGIAGTSIGSCVGFLLFAHEMRLRAGVFNHVSSYFGDVVWEGITTTHVRRGLESALSRDEVRACWLAISPNSYASRLKGSRRGLLISARYDLSFPFELSQLLFDECDHNGVNFDRCVVPWGHYTMGEAPFKYYDGYLIVNYLRKHL